MQGRFKEFIDMNPPMINKFDAQKNDYRAPKERNNNSHWCLTCGIMALPFHGFKPVVQKMSAPFWHNFRLRSRKL